MQIILLHFDEVKLTSHKKEENRTFIKILTGIKKYSAKKVQRDTLFGQITVENYNDMLMRCSKLSVDDKHENSSSFSYFINRFTDSSTEWISETNNYLEN